MRKFILMMLLAVVSSNSMAGWEKVSDSKNDGLTIYYEADTLHMTVGNVKVWNLFDFKKALITKSGKQLLSMKGLDEYDCNNKQYRRYYSMGFSGNMGEDEIIYTSSEPSKWTSITIGSVAETVWKAACRNV